MSLPDEKEGGKPNPTSKQALYSSASSHAIKAIKRLAELIDSKNEPVAVSAAKSLLAKCIPDLKSVEANLTGDIKGKWVVELRKYGNNTNDTDPSNLST